MTEIKAMFFSLCGKFAVGYSTLAIKNEGSITYLVIFKRISYTFTFYWNYANTHYDNYKTNFDL